MTSRAGAVPAAFATLLAAVCAVCLAAGADSRPDLPGRPLQAALAEHIRQPAFQRASWGILVRDANSGDVVFETNARKLLKPASNAKLFTAALALDQLGPDFRIATDILGTGRLTRRGTLRGDLIVYGRGDFSFAARFHEGDATVSLRRIVDAIRAQGVRRVQGDIVADDSFFAGAPFGASWTWDDLQYYYGAEVSALTTDDNVLDLFFTPGDRPGDPVRLQISPDTSYLRFDTGRLVTGAPNAARRVSVTRDLASREARAEGVLPAGGIPSTNAITVPEPGLFFAHRLREALAAEGISVAGDVRRSPGAAARAREGASLAIDTSVESPPLRELLPWMLKPSQNLYAQLLFLQAGASAGNPSEEGGLRALRRFLEARGIPASEVLLDEGSGLSRSCLVTPAAVVELLQSMENHPARDVFLGALPVAGVDGTLRRRFRDTAAEGNLRAKTGTLRYVNALSGFVTNQSGQRLVFAVILNAYDPPPEGPGGRAAVDEIGRLLAESRDVRAIAANPDPAEAAAHATWPR